MSWIGIVAVSLLLRRVTRTAISNRTTSPQTGKTLSRPAVIVAWVVIAVFLGYFFWLGSSLRDILEPLLGCPPGTLRRRLARCVSP
jgi:hypothetical protein